MFKNWQCLVPKILLIIMILIIFYSLTNRNKEETFIDSIENEKINYIKMKETYIESQDTSLDLLYANYSGEEVGQDIWENKTLDQCEDTCNKIEGCSGFSRDSVLDTEPANCYPRSTVNNCHSNRKGNSTQMNNALKYDSYVKSNIPNVLNNCIGDSDVTLNRLIFIKSYTQPKTYIGINGDSRVVLINKDTNNFNSNCNFRLEVGKDGIGTIAFLHIGSGKYLYRDIDDSIILKAISNPSKTIDNQRISFNLHDAVSGCVMLKTMKIDGETTDKFIMLDNNTNYLVAKSLNTSGSINSTTNSTTNSTIDNSNINNNSNAFFYIVDKIISSNIITNKNNIPTTISNRPTTTISNIPTTTTSNRPTTTTSNIPTTSTSYIEGFKNINEGFTLNLDTSSDLKEYNNLFNAPPNFILSDYIQDTYSPLKNSSRNSVYIDVSNKLNNIEINKQLSNSLTKNQDEYNAINELNKEIELEIYSLNTGLNKNNDVIINKLDKMRVSDLANDYFFLKNLASI